MRNAEVIRQWQILREIETHRVGVTIHELATSSGVTTRTIRRDLEALQEAGFPIFDEGAEHETKRWRLDGAPFRAVQEGLGVSELAALYLSRAVIDSVPGWPLSEELARAFATIERTLNPKMREFLATLPQVVSAKSGPRARGGAGALVDVTRRLFDAVRDRRVIEMRYFSVASNRAKSYRVEPYRLTLAQGGVYLIAWVPAYGAFRTFALERIERLSVLEETFRHTHPLPLNLFGASLGVFTGEPEHVELRFESRLAAFIQSRVWHDSQQVHPEPDGRLRLTLEVSDDWALRSWVLGFGSAVTVLAPATLAQAIARELCDASAHYR